MKDPDNCPKCGISWWGDSILESWKALRDKGEAYVGKTDAELEQYMKDSYAPPYRWRREIGIEYMLTNEDYDGISEYKCPDCHTRFGRWTGTEIPEGYLESQYGKRGHVKATKWHKPSKGEAD